MDIAIVGYSGLVGSNLLQFYKFNHFYNSKNFETASNKSFDIMFFCGIPSKKWYANKNPDEDNNNINKIKTILNTISVKKMILISTIDVYDEINSESNEDNNIIHYNNHPYGKNRFIFEEYIKSRFENNYIIRLCGLFGKGLTKNIIYDLINKNNIFDIQLNSKFQWYYLDWLKEDIDNILKNDIKMCNLVTEPIETRELVKTFKKIYNIDYEFPIEYLGNKTNIVNYNITTKYNRYFENDTKYSRTKEQVINGLIEYFKFEKKDKSRLCVSNICVNTISQMQFLNLLKLFGIKNIQIAPSKLIDSWNSIDNINLKLYTENGLNVYSFQSIAYGLSNLNIFDDKKKDEFYNHLIKVIDCAEKNNVKVLVFGCPKNRTIINVNDDNNTIFVDFFQKIGDYLQNKNLTICLENNSKEYNCNFINKIKEGAYFVRKINKKNIKLMVDLGNAVMEEDTWYYLEEHKDIIFNIDISQPNMKNFSEIHESNKIFKYVLENMNYDKIINLEMLIDDEINELSLIYKSLHNFIDTYS